MDREHIRNAALAADQIGLRLDLAKFTAGVFNDVGTELRVLGHLIGGDRAEGKSPFGHGDDATVAISMLLRIGCQLVSGSADLLSDGRHYAGSALIRQMVEIEYLAWAFESKDEEAARWIRSNRDERRNFFTPAKLRAAAQGKFRSLDYGYHCELGGHPVPGSWSLLNGDKAVAQLMLSDCLGHSGRVWDHTVGWARNHASGAAVLKRAGDMSERYARWKQADLLTALPPPPEFPQEW